MAADFNPLDTRGRAKVLAGIQQLKDAGLSPAEIEAMFARFQERGGQALRDYTNQAGLAISQQFQPQIEANRNFLGANPLYADSGVANSLNRRLFSDIGSRLAGDYGQHAFDIASQNLGAYQGLYGQRAGLGTQLAGEGYNSIFHSPKRPTTGQQIGQGLATLGGAALGTFLPGRGIGTSAAGDTGGGGSVLGRAPFNPSASLYGAQSGPYSPTAMPSYLSRARGANTPYFYDYGK